MADKKKAVSQSRTMWVAKGTQVGGKTVKKGYLAQYGRPEKKVTARVRLVEGTRRGEAGKTVRYKEGRYYKAPKTSNGSARTSSATKITEVTTNPGINSGTGKNGSAFSAASYSGKGRGAMDRARAGRTTSTVTAGQRAQSARLTGQAKAFADTKKRQDVARGRRETVGRAAALANPMTRPFAAGYMATSWARPKVSKAAAQVTRNLSRWWQGY